MDDTTNSSEPIGHIEPGPPSPTDEDALMALAIRLIAPRHGVVGEAARGLPRNQSAMAPHRRDAPTR